MSDETMAQAERFADAAIPRVLSLVALLHSCGVCLEEGRTAVLRGILIEEYQAERVRAWGDAVEGGCGGS